MTYKERLENIDKRAKHKVLGNIEGEIKYRLTEINTEDYEWLIEQAERVQELESNSYNAHLERLLDKREQEIERYREAIEYIQKEIRKAIYTPKKQKWSSDFEREFESGKTRGLIQASDIVKKAIEALEGEE